LLIGLVSDGRIGIGLRGRLNEGGRRLVFVVLRADIVVGKVGEGG
jgi:hypothetical protein